MDDRQRDYFAPFAVIALVLSFMIGVLTFFIKESTNAMTANGAK